MKPTCPTPSKSPSPNKTTPSKQILFWSNHLIRFYWTLQGHGNGPIILNLYLHIRPKNSIWKTEITPYQIDQTRNCVAPSFGLFFFNFYLLTPVCNFRDEYHGLLREYIQLLLEHWLAFMAIWDSLLRWTDFWLWIMVISRWSTITAHTLCTELAWQIQWHR